MEREQQLREAMQREYDQFADRLDEFRQRYEEAELFMKCRCGELHPKTKTDRRTDTSRYVRERGAYVPTKDVCTMVQAPYAGKYPMCDSAVSTIKVAVGVGHEACNIIC